jgi:hypothetical protein
MHRLRTVILRSLAILGMAWLCWAADPAWAAKSRQFLDLDLSVLQTLDLPQQTAQGQSIQDWTGLSYDRQTNRLYSLATIATDHSDATIYLAQLSLPSPAEKNVLSVETLTPLHSEGQPVTRDRWQPHSIALSPESSVFITGAQVKVASEPSSAQSFICEFSVPSGQQQTCLQLPDRYQSQPDLPAAPLGAVTLVMNGIGATGIDPFPLFAATEYATEQDVNEAVPSSTVPVRWLQALLNSGDRPFWLAEYAYPLDAQPDNGLEGLLALGQSAHFLSVEASRDPNHPYLRLYQVTVGDAMDTSRVDRLETLSIIKPLKKELLLDLTPQLPSANWQIRDLSDGPQLEDASQRIVLMGDRHLLVLKLMMAKPKRFDNL